MAQLRNSTAAATSVAAQSNALYTGPLAPTQLNLALHRLRRSYNELAQLVILLNQVAGPAVLAAETNPVGSVVRTVNLAFHPFKGWKTAYDGKDMMKSEDLVRIGSGEFASPVYLEQPISQPITTTKEVTDRLTTIPLGKNVLPINLSLNTPVVDGFIENAMSTRVRLVLGPNAGSEGQGGIDFIDFTAPLHEFVINAPILINSYKAVLNTLHDRINATAIPAGRVNEVWSSLQAYNPNMLSNQLDALTVLRDCAGQPIYTPPFLHVDWAIVAAKVLGGYVTDLSIPPEF